MTTRERILITGGASGIGRAIAENGAANGWDVVVLDR
jgi:NAD(P)-dependent dehydrogenase (short-subunit alcohol dehydrogenase family)